MLESYRKLLTYIKSAVTRNYSEKSINSILDYISNAKQMDLLQNFYELTLESLKHAKNERLWFKTNTKLASLYLQSQDWVKLQQVLKVSVFSLINSTLYSSSNCANHVWLKMGKRIRRRALSYWKLYRSIFKWVRLEKTTKSWNNCMKNQKRLTRQSPTPWQKVGDESWLE